MKVAVTSQGHELDSPVDPRFGRAACFLVVDTETGQFSAQDNSQNVSAVQGAGIQAGRAVVGMGVEAVITGNIGPKALSTLQAGHVKVYSGASGTVKEAIEQFKAGTLQAVERPTVEGHWT